MAPVPILTYYPFHPTYSQSFLATPLNQPTSPSSPEPGDYRSSSPFTTTNLGCDYMLTSDLCLSFPLQQDLLPTSILIVTFSLFALLALVAAYKERQWQWYAAQLPDGSDWEIEEEKVRGGLQDAEKGGAGEMSEKLAIIEEEKEDEEEEPLESWDFVEREEACWDEDEAFLETSRACAPATGYSRLEWKGEGEEGRSLYDDEDMMAAWFYGS